ncbi:MAG: thioesterase superfamily protein [Gammaproteobacteria bacterium]|nr:MAG: thioesterase superfamily protein [Gammaproteobacteria bacterium]
MSNKTLLHRTDMEVRWGDMDAVGHVNNTLYFRYFEQCRVSWLAEIGSIESVTTARQGPVIINTSASFLRPLHYPVRIVVSMFGNAPGRSSFESEFEIRDADNADILYSTGSAKIVWIDKDANKSIPLPDSIRALLPA